MKRKDVMNETIASHSATVGGSYILIESLCFDMVYTVSDLINYLGNHYCQPSLSTEV